jgi:hypothetical protein
MNKISVILLYSKERATFVDNPYNVIGISGNLLKQTKEGPYLKEVKWVVYKGHSGKDKTAEFRIFALQLLNLL